MIVHVRIDERLAHGQVCVRWVKQTKANVLVVFDDGTANNPLLKRVTLGVAPQGIKIEVLSRKDVDRLKELHHAPEKRVMVVTKTPDYVKVLAENEVAPLSVTVGNMGGGANRKKILSYVWISDEEKHVFQELMEMGIKIESQSIPEDKVVDLGNMIK